MRTTKTAKASIIRIAPPIVEEPSESLEPLKELFEKEETAYRLSFTKSMETGIYASYRSIKECAFSNITFIDSAFKSAQISDVVFRQCDFSNISFAGSSFYRVEFIDCKLMGTNFGESTFNHVRNSRYINLAMSKTNQMQFSRCDLQNGSLNDCRLQATAFEHCSLIQADFSHTRLRNIDLRTSRINGLQINISDLQGAIVSSIQAMELLPLLGVVINDDFQQ